MRYLAHYASISIIVLIDQVTKQLALQYLPYQVDVALLPFFSLYLTHNKGVAFGMFPSLFWVWTALITVFVIYAHFLVPKSTEHAKIPLMLLVGGALGNLIDRYTISAGVVDFFHLWNFAEILQSPYLFKLKRK